MDTAQGHDDDAPVADIDAAGGSHGEASISGDEDADSEEARDVDEPSSSSGGGLGGPGLDGSSGSSGGHRRGRQKQLQVTKLSKFEAGRLEQAKRRHKEQIARPKVRRHPGQCAFFAVPFQAQSSVSQWSA